MSECMAEGEAKIIRRFAEGEEELRSQAIAAHRVFLKRLNDPDIMPSHLRPGDRSEWPMEQQFMAEVDNIMSCFVLRDHYRQKLLEE